MRRRGKQHTTRVEGETEKGPVEKPNKYHPRYKVQLDSRVHFRHLKKESSADAYAILTKTLANE